MTVALFVPCVEAIYTKMRGKGVANKTLSPTSIPMRCLYVVPHYHVFSPLHIAYDVLQ